MLRFLKTILGVIGCLAAFSFAQAQEFPSELWHEGKLVHIEGDTIKGLIKYDLERDIIQVQGSNGKVEAVTARKLLFFEIFDKTVNRHRQFYALPYKNSSNYLAPLIFEVLFEGKLTLLTREALALQTSSYGTGAWAGSGYTKTVLVYNYYFLKEKGEIIPYFGKKKDLLFIMKKKSGDVKQYIKKNRLRYDNKSDLTRIVAYYNSITSS